MPFPVAHIPVPQAGMNLDPMTQYGAMGGFLAGLIPLLLGGRKDQNPQQQQQQMGRPPQSADQVIQEALQRYAPQQAQQAQQAQPAQQQMGDWSARAVDNAANNAANAVMNPEQAQNNSGDDIFSRISAALRGQSGVGAAGSGNANMGGDGQGQNSPMSQIQNMLKPPQAMQTAGPAAVPQGGGGPNAEMLKAFGPGTLMQRNQFGGPIGPAATNPFYAQLMQRMNNIG